MSAARESVAMVDPGPLSRIGRAVQARLQLVFPLAKFEQQFMPAKLGPAEWKSLMRRTPFVGLGWADVEANRDAGRLFAGESRWSVFLATRNTGSVGARYFGDAQGPGLFPMVQAAVALLHGWTIPAIGTAMVSRAANVYAEGWEDEAAMAAVDFAVATEITVAGALTAPDDLGLFQKLGVTWNWDGEDALVGDLVEIAA
ncbi:MAG: hypothetical protein M0002_08170 [Rhodospirillales bacterium]|nr:hypothetical protein [Rhodospirillales bacterium]